MNSGGYVPMEVAGSSADRWRRSRRRERYPGRLLGNSRAILAAAPALLVSLICLGGCAGSGEGFWPSISPTPRGAAAPPRPFLSLLPENLWELLGGMGLLASGGGVAFFLWKFPGLLEEFTGLKKMAERLHERRDSSTADLVQLSRRLTELEQQIVQIRRAGQRRADLQGGERSPAAPSQHVDPRESSPPSAPTVPDHRRDAPPLAPQWPQVLEPGGVPEPDPDLALDLASDAIVSEGSASLALGLTKNPPPAAAPSLEVLIAAINGESDGPIEGVTSLELDIAPGDESGELAPPLATRLRLVAGGGRFLLVLLDGDPWLFPTVETLANFRTSQPVEGIFHYLHDVCASPRLVFPAMLREVGGLWEVSDQGQILVPTA